MKKPTLHPSTFVAPNATVLGDVTLGDNSSIFYGAVLRADCSSIDIGTGSNIQDGCIIHVDPPYPVVIGNGCTVGHGAILHGCTVGDNSLIGMGAIVLNGAQIGKNCIIGAGALVTQNTVIPDGSLVIGSPAKVKRSLTPEEIEGNRQTAENYIAEITEYKNLTDE